MNATRQLARRDILRLLQRAGELGATAQLLQTSMNAGGTPVTVHEVESDLRYLAGPGKEYVRVKELHVDEVGTRLHAVLLPKGQDLLEGNIPADPGVMEAYA